MIKINLWSSPRNVSTAFMYSFAQRADTTVLDEPLYAHFLRETGTEHPGREETLASMEQDGAKVVAETLLGEFPTPVVFFKQMTHHLVKVEWDFMKDMKNIVFIRNPDRILASYTKVIEQPQMRDIGMRQQWELLQYLKENDCHYVILDSKDLLTHPSVTLEKLCKSLDIPYDASMLTWQKGARPEDGVWAKYWYHNVHNSTGFKPYIEKEVILPASLYELADECQKYYGMLKEAGL